MKRLVFVLLILVFLFPTLLVTAGANDEIKAPDFTATDQMVLIFLYMIMLEK